MTENKLLKEYLKLLNYNNMPSFLYKYLNCPSLVRLKNIGYFCGMDYASKDIYDFGGYVSRFDHSLTTALLTWNLIKEKEITLAALFHDVSTPCFSHVIDYMNKDYNIQESTEKYTEEVLKNDQYLMHILNEENIELDSIINFKNYSIVDLDRPMLCADRVDGIILNGLFWTKVIDINETKRILDSINLYINENNVLELGFNDYEVSKMVIEKNDLYDTYCHTNEDNYMMELLASITKICIEKDYIKYKDLYFITEKDIISIIINSNDIELINLWNLFTNIKKEQIPSIELPLVKKRIINPIINGSRLNKK